jgi:hypothetical protein
VLPKKLSTAKNLELLVEYHLASGHVNFETVATRFGLTLPVPAPQCWACMLAKPRRISPDAISTRQADRPHQAFAADAKGPINTPTPEGYIYYYLIVDLFCSFFTAILCKTQAAWKDIWPTFVKRIEARAGKERCVSYLIADGAKVHLQQDIKIFNDSRGIEGITTAPYSQWQDPAERGIQTLSAGTRASMIHGGAKDYMWGYGVLHTVEGINRMDPPRVVLGYEGKSRLRISDPSMTTEKEMRTQKPFLCLCFKTLPERERGSNFNPRADPCVHLYYDRTKKAYVLLTIPNLYVTYSIEVRFVTQAFPLRVTNYLSNQLDTFLHPTDTEDAYAQVHGPGNVLRRNRLAGPSLDPTLLVENAPTLVRQPVVPVDTPGPGYSRSRGYMPSQEGLQSAASMHTIVDSKSYTPDQLVARTPRSAKEALNGPDSAYWEASMLKDFAVIRDNKCLVNVTSSRPSGPAPPPVTQRFKIKYRAAEPIKLEDIPSKDWKTRTVVRGDRMKEGVHYDATDAPVVHAPVVKVLLAWAVELGLLVYEWDVTSAFYGNEMDRVGVIVQLAPGYDPDTNVLRPLNLPPLYGELAKGLPGIPQGSRLQYRELAPQLQRLGLQPADADNCLFVHPTLNIATSIHVDDGLLAVPSLAHAEAILGLKGLGSFRKITWGPLHTLLGSDFEVHYTPERRMIFMSQRSYALTILERANMMDCNPAPTPASPGHVYTKDDCPKTAAEVTTLAAQGMTKGLYHTLTASTNFLVCTTREDMRFIQGKTSKSVTNPGLNHWAALKRQLRFLKGTIGYGVEFTWSNTDVVKVDGPLYIEAWSDSSYADDVDTARTTLGYVIKVNGATVAASSKLSERVDSCVNHSELRAFDAVSSSTRNGSNTPTDGASVAFVKTARNLAWLRGVKAVLEHRDIRTMPPTKINVDNAGVLSMLEGATLKSANKHIFKTLAENRERVNLDKSVIAIKIDTTLNLANAMTKQEHGLPGSAAQLQQIAGPPSFLFQK